MTDYTGKKVIVRADRAGVFYGTLLEHDKANAVAELKDCRRIWYWSGAASISQLANEGVKDKANSKFTVTVPSIVIGYVIEIIPCTENAIANIESVKEWKM